jgi:thioredoxin reductase (NADPH)
MWALQNLNRKMEIEKTKVLIIGSGPAGYTAGIYAGRANLNPILYTGLQSGGQLMDTTDVENFPGYPRGILGTELMDDLKNQAERFGTEVRFGLITAIDYSKIPYLVKIDNQKTIEAESIILATGASAKWLGLDSEKKFNGYGVSACATCDGFFYKGKNVIVVGGGDTATEEALYLSNMCKTVTILVRGEKLRASQIMQERISKKENISINFNTEIKEILGDLTVNGVRLIDNISKEIYDKQTDGIFIAIGHKPNSDLFKSNIDLDEEGYVITKSNTSLTNIEGIFACGDLQDKHYRQAVTAAGSGCIAALDAERYLNSKN